MQKSSKCDACQLYQELAASGHPKTAISIFRSFNFWSIAEIAPKIEAHHLVLVQQMVLKHELFSWQCTFGNIIKVGEAVF